MQVTQVVDLGCSFTPGNHAAYSCSAASCSNVAKFPAVLNSFVRRAIRRNLVQFREVSNCCADVIIVIYYYAVLHMHPPGAALFLTVTWKAGSLGRSASCGARVIRVCT